MTPRLAFIDWMKAAGMFLIVFGHVVGGNVNFLTPPIYQKQLGVAFFMFVSGYTLARETRPTRNVVVQRLFEVLLVGWIAALLVTATSLAVGGRGQFSNYLPLLFGVNVALDNFPANPSTWYIGTYTHFIALWALLRRHVRPTPAWLVGAAAIEIGVRAALWQTAGGFVAYMALTNWLTAALLGLHVGGRAADDPPPAWWTVLALASIALPIALGGVATYDDGFPFRLWNGGAGHLVSSVGVTAFYGGAAWLAYRAGLALPVSGVVEALSRQTVVIFVAHMPLYYAVYPYVAAWSPVPRATLLVVLCYPGLAIAGWLVYRVLPLRTLRDRCLTLVAGPARR
jgi:fucose 4-O-acetylase-like acetyltransferase